MYLTSMYGRSNRLELLDRVMYITLLLSYLVFLFHILTLCWWSFINKFAIMDGEKEIRRVSLAYCCVEVRYIVTEHLSISNSSID